MITWFLTSRVGRALAALTGAIAAFLGVYLMGRREGSQRAGERAKDADRKRADDIRNRVERDTDGKLRDYADKGYRD